MPAYLPPEREKEEPVFVQKSEDTSKEKVKARPGHREHTELCDIHQDELRYVNSYQA